MPSLPTDNASPFSCYDCYRRFLPSDIDKSQFHLSRRSHLKTARHTTSNSSIQQGGATLESTSNEGSTMTDVAPQARMPLLRLCRQYATIGIVSSLIGYGFLYVILYFNVHYYSYYIKHHFYLIYDCLVCVLYFGFVQCFMLMCNYWTSEKKDDRKSRDKEQEQRKRKEASRNGKEANGNTNIQTNNNNNNNNNKSKHQKQEKGKSKNSRRKRRTKREENKKAWMKWVKEICCAKKIQQVYVLTLLMVVLSLSVQMYLNYRGNHHKTSTRLYDDEHEYACRVMMKCKHMTVDTFYCHLWPLLACLLSSLALHFYVMCNNQRYIQPMERLSQIYRRHSSTALPYEHDHDRHEDDHHDDDANARAITQHQPVGDKLSSPFIGFEIVV
ncbi:hypothetical protein RFI_01940, partial [Reticulomyxa filosa]